MLNSLLFFLYSPSCYPLLGHLRESFCVFALFSRSSTRFLRDAKPVRVILDIFSRALPRLISQLAKSDSLVRLSRRVSCMREISGSVTQNRFKPSPASPKYIWPHIWRRMYFELSKNSRESDLLSNYTKCSRYNVAFHARNQIMLYFWDKRRKM